MSTPCIADPWSAVGSSLSLAALALPAAAAARHGQNPNTAAPHARRPTRPGAATADVQAFKINLWDNIKATNRCGSCHDAGGQSPLFAREDDVNLAYAEANTRRQPDDSPDSPAWC